MSQQPHEIQDVDERHYSTILRTDDYLAAQTAVDRLSDAKFPVDGLRIVGHDMKSVEVVTGRLTTAKAAGFGALSGAWFGLFIGLLLGIFAVVGWLAIVATAVVLGAVFGAVFGAIGHAMTGGRRDFSSARALEATRYEVMVPSDLAAEAQSLLGG